MKPLIYSTLALLLLCGASCKKKTDREIEKSQKRLYGKWTVSKIVLHQTDTLGNLVRDTSMDNQGTLEFSAGDANGTGIAYFSLAKFEGACANSELVYYFRSQNAGDPTTAGGWSLSWDADPQDVRIQFWGVTGGGSLHRAINVSYSGKGTDNQQMYYVVENTSQNRRSFYTWTMSK